MCINVFGQLLKAKGQQLSLGRKFAISGTMRVILWFILLVLCWPLAIALLFLYPVIWLLLLPFRLVGIAVEGVFSLIGAIFMLPARILGR